MRPAQRGLRPRLSGAGAVALSFRGQGTQLRRGECEREPVEDVDGRVEFLALNSAHLGPINESIDGQVLLKDPTFDPGPPEIIGNTRTPIHGGTGPSCPSLRHGIDSTCFGFEGAPGYGTRRDRDG